MPTGPMIPVDEPPLSAELIRSRADRLLARLRATAERAGRDPDGFRLVAVTKGFDIGVARMALAAGLTRLGENRVQEALSKVGALPAVEWHLVGHLQSNKARPAVNAFDWIHSVDSVALLERLEAIAHDDGRQPRLLLQVNVTGEPGKSGFALDAFADAAADPRSALVGVIRALRHVRLVGLMTIARAGAGDGEARETFARLRALRDRLAATATGPLPELSMGMTADAEAAVAEGATLVRVGTALFGPRPA